MPDPGGGGRLVVISGPSGSGKSTICRELLKDPRVRFSVSATTRPQRKGERDGVDYHFLTEEAFQGRIAAGEFLEHARYNGHLYGTPAAPVERMIAEGHVVLLEIEVQGTKALREKRVQGLYLFVVPPSFEVLRNRLLDRGTDAPEDVERRLEIARSEMELATLYDHQIVNDDVPRAVAEARSRIGLAPAAAPGGAP